ncbi:MAG: hypothetical protein AAFX05_02020 [Planctomycetota bacterium]
MTTSVRRPIPWEDKFNEPSIDEVRSHYAKPERDLFDAARSRILEFPKVEESFGWLGLPWRWCFSYTLPGDPTRAWAYLVPDPASPRVAMPFTEDMLKAMPVHRFKRHLKDGLAAAVEVGGIFWATFEITSKSQLDDVMDVVKRKHAQIVPKK